VSSNAKFEITVIEITVRPKIKSMVANQTEKVQYGQRLWQKRYDVRCSFERLKDHQPNARQSKNEAVTSKPVMSAKRLSESKTK
jgi:hypothetical protein